MASPGHSPSSERRRALALAIVVAGWLSTSPALAGEREGEGQRGESRASREGIRLPRLGAGVVDLAGSRHPLDLYLEVFYGDRPTGRIARLRLHRGALSATAETLGAIGLVVPPGVEGDGNGWIPLAALPGLAYRYEPTTQRLILQPAASLRPTQRLGYEPPKAVEVRRDPGWLLSYDAYGRGLEDVYSFAVAHGLRWFGPAGAFEVTGVGQAGDGASSYQRLDSFWTYSDSRRMWTWTAGDLISGGLAWTRPVRVGGLQWRRNFGVRPDLITLPMPRFTADATVPSSVELYVNNVRQFGAEVQDGPFVLDALPRISGAGHATLIVTDPLGRVTETTVPLYVDHVRLAPGLTDFSLEAGVLRHGFGGEEDDYGRDAVASASLRHGVTDTLTLEAHGEAGPGVRLAGVGTVWSPANRWGLVTASYARGDGDRRGGQHAFGYQWSSESFGFDAQTLRRSDGFRDLGDISTEEGVSVEEGTVLPSLRAQDRVTVWLPLGRGSVAATWLRWRDGERLGHRTRSLSWTRTFGTHLSLSATLFDDDDAGGGGGLSLTVPLGPRLYAAAGVQRSQDRTSGYTALRRSAPYQGGWGWSVEAGDRPGGYAQAAVEVRGPYGAAELGVDRTEDQTGSFFQGSGSVALMDGHLFLSRRIHDAFAVVSTNGQGSMPVLSENRLFGRTNRAGYLLVPDLRGWQGHLIAVDPDELGPDYRVEDLETTATPADHGGVLVRFDIERIQPAVLVLLDPAGEPVPAGRRGRVVGTGEVIVVGFGGEAYVEDITGVDVIEVAWNGVRCRYRIPKRHRSPAPVRRERLVCQQGSS